MNLSRLIRSSACPRAVASSAALSSSSTAESRRPLMAGDVLRDVRRFSADDVASYADVSGDKNPVHLDPEFARRIAGFDRGSIVHGMLVASIFPSVIASHFPGAVYVSQTIQFKLPVYVNDEVTAELQAINLREHKKKYIVKFTTKCFMGERCLVVDGEAVTILPTLISNK